MQKMKWFVVIMISITFAACDKIEEGEYLQTNANNPNNPDTTTVVHKQNILIEDFTAHNCVSCPDAHDALKALEEAYGDQIIGVGIHTGSLGAPDYIHEGFDNDWRIPMGEQLANDMNVQAIPIGMVNRKEYSGSILISHTSWASEVPQIISQSPSAYIEMNPSFANNKINLQVTTHFLTNQNQPVNLTVYIVEDSIVAGQKRGTEYIQYYTHRFMLKGSINTSHIYGDALTTQAASGDSIVKSYQDYAIPNSWNENQIYLIALIFNPTTNEVIQAERVKLIR